MSIITEKLRLYEKHIKTYKRVEEAKHLTFTLHVYDITYSQISISASCHLTYLPGSAALGEPPVSD